MKYARLTKEQLEELHPEFINFLALQAIDKDEWQKITQEKPEVALQEIDVFSDLIWERALEKVTHIDHFSKQYIFLFKCDNFTIFSYIIKANIEVDFMQKEGIEWLSNNLFSDDVEITTAKKEVKEDRNKEIFSLINKGGIISKGELFSKLEKLIQL